MSHRCAACGHTEQDHADGYMGARVNNAWLCHQDDHSCYLPASSLEAPRKSHGTIYKGL